MTSKPYALFEDVLEQTLAETSLNAPEMMAVAESFFAGHELADLICGLDLKAHFETRLGHEVSRVCLLPCSSFTPQIEPAFSAAFDEVVIADNFKDGEVNGRRIVKPGEVCHDEVDAFLILTRDLELQKELALTLPSEKVIAVQEVISHEARRGSVLTDSDSQAVTEILDAIAASQRPVVVINGIYFNNYTPTYQALEAQGYDVFMIARHPNVSYAAPDSRFDDLPFKHRYGLSMAAIVTLTKRLDRGVILLNNISFCLPRFDAVPIIAGMAYASAVMDMARVPVLLYLYDMVMPFKRNRHLEGDFLKMYRAMLQRASGLILNSNTEGAVTFFKRALGFDKPIISFLRYNVGVDELAQTRSMSDGFHLSVVGGCDDGTRNMLPYFKSMISQGIHIHNYVNVPFSDAWYAELPEEEKVFFHRHPSIMDQESLIKEISQFHAGWIADDTHAWADIIAGVKEPLLKDLLILFRLTTVASSLLCLASAGLPVFLNRTVVEIAQAYPDSFFAPLEYSETAGLGKWLSEQDWESRLEETRKQRALFSVDNQIERLVGFVDRFLS